MHLSMMTSNQCNYLCRHCIESSSPNEQHRLPVEKIKELINAAAAISKNGKLRISFTGGEPFLYFKDLLESAWTAKNNQAYRIDCVTNGFWAISREEAKHKLWQAKRAGIDHIAFSYDEYHKEFISMDAIRNAFCAAVQVGMNVKFKIVLFKGSERAHHFLEKLKDVTVGTGFSVEEIMGLPMGRARDLPEDVFCYQEVFPGGKCPGMGNILVRYDGNVYPCCCPSFSSPLYLGNIHHHSFKDIYHKAKSTLLFQVLQDKGPVYFLPYLKEAGVCFEEGRFVDQCHLCKEVLGSYTHSEKAKVAFEKAMSEWADIRQKEKDAFNILASWVNKRDDSMGCSLE